MASKLHGDFETASVVDLRTQGAYVYAEHPLTRIWVLCYAFDDEPVEAWHPGQPFPQRLADHVGDGGVFGAHNAAFERLIWNGVLRRAYPQLPRLSAAQMDCTMARCSALGIPPKLEQAAHVLNLPERKDKEGHALMVRMSRPRTTPCLVCDGAGCDLCDWWGENYTWYDDEGRMSRLTDYCKQDVETERALARVAPSLSTREHEVWLLDQDINDRGVMIDRTMVTRAIAVVGYATATLDRRIAALTDGAVKACSNASAIRDYLNAEGLRCDSIAKDQHPWLKAEAAREGRFDLVEVINLRREAGKASTAKFDAALRCIGADDRARGLLFYHAAHTGRWGGRLFQPHNLYRVDAERDGDNITAAINILLSYDDTADAHDMLDLLIDAPMVIIPKTIRQMIVASPGHHFVGGDQSNIEGRLAAWFADEDWKLDAFRAYDAKLGPDLYKISYSKSFGTALESVTQPQRQIGKVQELALGYQGSVGAYIDMGKNYGLKPADLVGPVRATMDEATWLMWLTRYETAKNKFDLPQDQWAAIGITVYGWRRANSRIVQSWWDLQDAAVEALANPGRIVSVLGNRVMYLYNKEFLWLHLPASRTIAYAKPELRTYEQDVYEDENGRKINADDYFDFEIEALVKEGKIKFAFTRKKRVVLYEGFDSEKRIWVRQALYGGMQFNHVVQGTARDVIADNALDAERAGYPVVLTVHDELLCEPPAGFGSAEELRKIMGRVPAWLPNAPLAVKTWEGLRYEK